MYRVLTHSVTYSRGHCKGQTARMTCLQHPEGGPRPLPGRFLRAPTERETAEAVWGLIC